MRQRVIAGCAFFALLGASLLPQIPASQVISVQDKALGAKSHPQLLAEYGGAYAGTQASYAARVGRRVAAQSGIAGVDKDFTFTLLNSSVENAFAIPGGYVYCTRELLALMNDEAELAAVLGHESGHIAAHHAEKRNQVSQSIGLLGQLGQAATGYLFGNSSFGQLANKVISLGTALPILYYSRGEEFEADDLGVVFIDKAGYDPHAAADMLTSLAAQLALDQKLSGTRSTPSWASSHPDPASRVQRALERAEDRHSINHYRNADAFLTMLDGMLYGDDPEQGVIDGRDFKFPAGHFQFTAPVGTQMSNGAQEVSIDSANSHAIFGGGAFNGDFGGYIDGVFKALGGTKGAVPHSPLVRGTINGIETATSRAMAQNADGELVDITVVTYALTPRKAYHFIVMSPRGTGLGDLATLTESFHQMTAAEVAAVHPRRVSIVTVREGDSIASLSARMAFSTLREERFRVLNGLGTSDALMPGHKVKLIVWG